MEQTGPTNDPFRGFPFPRGITPLQCHLYAGAKNICSGAYLHRKAAIQLIWQSASITWHPWIDRALKSFCDYNWVTWTGPAASAKSFNASLIGLLFWLEFPEGTSVIMASTTRDALARRLWYYIQDLHSKIRPRPELTIGQALYSEYMIRLRAGDKKNGIFGLAIEDGPVEEALHNLIGYHNTRVLLVVDEAQGTREAIFQATDNLAKNPEFKCLLLGNAESREDPHGRFSEPLSGWISVDPDSSEQWETRGGPAKGLGCCVFFDGRKSPAITEPGGETKYPFLINQRQIDDALAYHGTTEHPRFWSQSIGFWPPVGITQTVLDERIVLNNHLRDSAAWYTEFQQCAVLDPSYEGGDRKVFLPSNSVRYQLRTAPVNGSLSLVPRSNSRSLSALTRRSITRSSTSASISAAKRTSLPTVSHSAPPARVAVSCPSSAENGVRSTVSRKPAKSLTAQ